jgi:hypothetical protein
VWREGVLEECEGHADVGLSDVVDDVEGLAHLHQPLRAEALREPLAELGGLQQPTRLQHTVSTQGPRGECGVCGVSGPNGAAYFEKPSLERRREFVSGGFNAAVDGLHQLRFDHPAVG